MSENREVDKIQSLYISFQDLQAGVRKLQNEIEVKRNKKVAKEKELNLTETQTRDSENELNAEKQNLAKLINYNKALQAQAEKERVEQYAVYLELLSVEEHLKTLEKVRLSNKLSCSKQLREMAKEQFEKREVIKRTVLSGDHASEEKKQEEVTTEMNVE